MSQHVEPSRKWPTATINSVTLGRLTSLRLSLHLPQWEMELNTQPCKAGSPRQALASPQEMVSCDAAIPISDTHAQEEAAGWGWTGKEFASVSALLPNLHPSVVSRPATGAHLPAFNPTAAID